MAWTPQKTWGSEILTSSDLNVYLRDDMEFLKGRSDGLVFSGTRVSRAATQSIPTATDTAISFDTEVYDHGGWWSSGTTVTVPAGAIPAGFTTVAIHVIGRLRYVANGTGYRKIKLLRNGAQIIGNSASGDATETTEVSASDYTVCAAGDAITMQALQSSGGALNVDIATLVVVRFMPVE